MALKTILLSFKKKKNGLLQEKRPVDQNKDFKVLKSWR
jgi:hypothetical protein